VLDVNDVQGNLQKLDKLPTGAIATLMMALIFNRTVPDTVRTLSAVVAKRLNTLAEIDIPAGARLLTLDSLAPKTIAHSLGLYEQSETGCGHFDGVEAPDEEQVASLIRLIEASDIYVVVRDFEAFEQAEELYEQTQGANQVSPSDIPEDPQQHVGTPLSPTPTPISEDRFARLFPNSQEAAEQAAPVNSLNVRAKAALAELEDAATQSGLSREDALSQLDKAHSFIGQVLELARQ
jgi:hypothetical protein